MAICNFCKRKIKELPFHCHRCGKIYCSKHHLPEDHRCSGLEREKSKNQERWSNIIGEELVKISKKEEESFISYPTQGYIDTKRHSKPKKRKSYLKYALIAIGIIILFFVISKGGIINLIKPELNCSDGTKYDYCSIEKPLFCFNGTLINNSERCGCPYDYKRDGDTCKKVQRCSDGTEYGTCSSKKPLYCLNGTIISKSSVCGCPYEYISQGEICISKYQTNPKNISLTYTLRGSKKSFDWEVYEGLNNYVAGITRTISYYEGQAEPTLKDFILKNVDNQKQKEFLTPLINKIESLYDNEDDRARITISIIQNIPYDYSEDLKGRYYYQVLYDNKGVCGEKSPLLASLLRELGYSVAIIDFGNVEPSQFVFNFGFSHEAVGIKCPLEYSYDNTGFCFIETTRPSIITDSEGEYPSTFCLTPRGSTNSTCTQKLPEEYTLTIISDGKSFDSVSEEFKDAQEWNRIMGISEKSGGYLDYSDYSKWEKLVKKYGMTFDN